MGGNETKINRKTSESTQITNNERINVSQKNSTDMKTEAVANEVLFEGNFLMSRFEQKKYEKGLCEDKKRYTDFLPRNKTDIVRPSHTPELKFKLNEFELNEVE